MRRSYRYLATRNITLMLAIGLLAGCVTGPMREATADFAHASQTATTSQSAWLTKYTNDERERLRDDWASDQLRLVFSPTCAAVVAVGDQAALDRALDGCRVSKVENGSIKPVQDFESFDGILGLNTALNDYANSLVLLTADWSDDKKQLAEEANATGQALQGLHGSIAKISKSKSDGVIEQAPAIGGILGTIAGAYLEAERLSALRKILTSADPLIEISTTYLAEADELALAKDRKEALETLSSKVDTLRDLPGTAPKATFRKAQDDVWAAHASLMRVTRVKSPFPQMRKAHAKLLIASRKGANAEELQAAVLEVLDFAHTVKDTAEALSEKE